MRFQISNSKHQITNNTQIPIINIQKVLNLVFRYLNLFVNCKLEIGNLRSRFLERHGYAAITATIIILAVSLVIIGGFTFFVFQEVNTNRIFTKSIESRFISESGIEDATYRIVTGKQIGSSETLGVGKGTTTISVTTTPDNKRIVRSEGRRDKFQQNLETRIDVSVEEAQFFYGAQVGYGGLEMDPNSSVQGSIFSNGPIIGDSGTTVTGDAFAAGVSTISNMIINGNAQANLISDSTVGGYASSTTKLDEVIVGLDAHAYELYKSNISRDAYYTVKDSGTVILGTSYPGRPGPPNLDPLSMPIPDSVIDQWKQEAQSIGTIAAGNCSQNWSPPTDTYTVNGGVLERNLVLDNHQILILKGTVWVKCNVRISNGATINLDPSYGDSSGVLLSDGWMDFQNNGQFQGSGTPGSYLMLLTTAVGGGDHNSAIDLHNNATGALFYAQNGLVYLHNGVVVSGLVGYKVFLNNLATLIYEIGLQNVKFSAGPAGGYDVKYWKEVE